MLNVSFTAKGDSKGLEKLMQTVNDLKNKSVCIGVPDEDTDRPKDKITNAELLFIHSNGVRRRSMINEMQHNINEKGYKKAFAMYIQEHGSPLWHSPPRPVIEPAINDGKDMVIDKMGNVLEAVLSGEDYMSKFKIVGMLGQNLARDWFTNPKNGWAPNSPLTIKKKGSDRPLIDTAELRKSITYVIEDKQND